MNFAIILKIERGVKMNRLSLDYLAKLYFFAGIVNKIEGTKHSAIVLQAVEILPILIVRDGKKIVLKIIAEIESFLLDFSKKDFK